MDLAELQAMMVKRGELINESCTVTKAENELGQALLDANINVFPQHKVGDYEFDLKIKGYPLLVECDGRVHDRDYRRYKDYLKDRYAIRQGLTVLRYSNTEIKHKTQYCVDEIRSLMKGRNSSREIYIVVRYSLSYKILRAIKDVILWVSSQTKKHNSNQEHNR